jgi:hypothetical protein
MVRMFRLLIDKNGLASGVHNRGILLDDLHRVYSSSLLALIERRNLQYIASLFSDTKVASFVCGYGFCGIQ